MSWMCVLALTTCINTQGQMLPSDDVMNLLDNCRVAERFAVSDYKESDGAIWAELLYRDGLRFSRADTAAQLRRNVLAACKALEKDFNNDAKWIPKKKPWSALVGKPVGDTVGDCRCGLNSFCCRAKQEGAEAA